MIFTFLLCFFFSYVALKYHHMCLYVHTDIAHTQFCFLKLQNEKKKSVCVFSVCILVDICPPSFFESITLSLSVSFADLHIMQG